MQFIALKEKLRDFTLFSITEIRKLDSGFHRRRLNEWQDKGYIKKVIKGYYIFSDLKLNENVLFEIANRIYSPSYISLEMALSYYGLIPESVYAVTSVTSRRTYRFNASIATFLYKTIKASLFFGYELIQYNNKSFKIASLEKTILDYFYINPHKKTHVDFASLRINKDMLFKQLDEEKLMAFLERFAKNALARRVKSFLEFMKSA